MGWRFRQRIRIVPGIWLNASKSGLSASIGSHGLTANFNPARRGIRVTESIPGTGLSYSQTLGGDRRSIQQAGCSTTQRKGCSWWLLIALAFVIWHVVAHAGKHDAAPTAAPAAFSRSEQWQHSGQRTNALESPPVNVPKAESVASGELPNRRLTPGDVFDVTVNDLRVRGYSRRVRNVPES
jgi:hypothetical protein